MKKLFLSFLAILTISSCTSFAASVTVRNYKTSNTIVQTNCPNVGRYNGAYRTRYYGAVVSSGTNFISRDKATGEIKQVVQVAPPRASYAPYYY